VYYLAGALLACQACKHLVLPALESSKQLPLPHFSQKISCKFGKICFGSRRNLDCNLFHINQRVLNSSVATTSGTSKGNMLNSAIICTHFPAMATARLLCGRQAAAHAASSILLYVVPIDICISKTYWRTDSARGFFLPSYPLSQGKWYP